MTLREQLEDRGSIALMSQRDLIANLQSSLKSCPSTLEQLLVEHASLWHPLGWDASQVSLWLACLPTVRRFALATGEVAYALDSASPAPANSLTDELVGLLHKAGRPMPLAQLLGKLPPGMVVTEPMLRTAALQDARLELKGPLLKLA